MVQIIACRRRHDTQGDFQGQVEINQDLGAETWLHRLKNGHLPGKIRLGELQTPVVGRYTLWARRAGDSSCRVR